MSADTFTKHLSDLALEIYDEIDPIMDERIQTSGFISPNNIATIKGAIAMSVLIDIMHDYPSMKESILTKLKSS